MSVETEVPAKKPVRPKAVKVEEAPVDLADLVPDPEKSEIDRLITEPVGPLTLSTGSVVIIKPLKLREFLRLLKVVTRGAGSLLQDIQLDFEDAAAFTQTLLAVVLFAVPEAEEETVEFIQSIVDPANLSQNPDPKVRNVEVAEARYALIQELENPELEDMIEILTTLIRTEGRDLQSLGKKMRTMFQTAQKLGALNKPATK